MLPPTRLLAAAIVVSLLLCATAAASQVAPDELLARAREVYETSGPADALPLFEGALASFRSVGDRRGEAISLGLIGNCHKRLGDLGRALEELRQALAMKRELERPARGGQDAQPSRSRPLGARRVPRGDPALRGGRRHRRELGDGKVTSLG